MLLIEMATTTTVVTVVSAEPEIHTEHLKDEIKLAANVIMMI